MSPPADDTPTETQQPVLRPWARRLLYVVSGISFAAFAFVPHTWAATRDNASGYQVIASIGIMHVWIVQTISWAALGCFGASLLAGGWIVYRHESRRALGLLSLALIAYPLASFLSVTGDLGPWTVYGELVGPESRTYSFLDSSFLQGQTMVLAHGSGDGLFCRTFEVLGETNGDSPRSWASIIRPAHVAYDSYGQLYLSPNGWLVGVRYENRCYISAYK